MVMITTMAIYTTLKENKLLQYHTNNLNKLHTPDTNPVL